MANHDCWQRNPNKDVSVALRATVSSVVQDFDFTRVRVQFLGNGTVVAGQERDEDRGQGGGEEQSGFEAHPELRSGSFGFHGRTLRLN